MDKEPIAPRTLYGVIGWPLDQTLSPLVHNTGFMELGIPGAYLKWPLAPQNLGEFIAALPLFNVQGLSVTIPHKIAIMPLLGEIGEQAGMAGAVNTVFWRNGVLCGDNTDVAGFMLPLRGIAPDLDSVLLLGAGGAARAALAGLRLLGCPNILVASPGNRRQYPLAEEFGIGAIRWEDRYRESARLVVNATPVGMHGALVNDSPYDFARAPAADGGWAYDIVYNPLMTRFLREARAASRKIISGMDMFFGQASEQFRVWTGRELPLSARAALEKALEG